MARPAEFLQIVAQLCQLWIVAGAEGGKGHLLITGVIAGLLAVVHTQILAAVSHRAVHIARLAKPAPPDAAAKQLQGHPILNDLRRGNDGLGGVIRLVHILHDALAYNPGRAVSGNDLLYGAIRVIRHRIQTGHIQTRHTGSSTKEFLFTPPFSPGLSVQLNKLHRHILSLTQADDVHKVGNRLRVIHGGAAGYDQGCKACAVCAVQGYTRQVQHI